MIKVRAHIELDKHGRKTAFVSGYRPLFDFAVGMKTSGQISLIDRTEFLPGEQGAVEITFANKEYLGASFGIGTKFTFSEGGDILGQGYIKAVLPLPDFIGSAKVLLWQITESHQFSGSTEHYKDGEILGPQRGLAICKYDNEEGYYLFGCDQHWNSITDTWHETMEDARDQAESEYKGTIDSWLAI